MRLRPATFHEVLRAFWPSKGRQRAVVAGYEALAAHPETLADIALRGSVFQAVPPDEGDRQAAVIEGRRQMALEIIKAAGQDPIEIYRQIETYHQSKTGERT